MITPNVEERLESTVNRLRDWRTVRYEFLPVVYTDEVNDKQVLPIDFNSWKNFEKPYTIYEEDKYFWFKANFEIKRKNSHQRAYFVLDNHIDGRFVASTIRQRPLPDKFHSVLLLRFAYTQLLYILYQRFSS